MKKRYQIDKQRAVQNFRREAVASGGQIQFALPLPEVLALVQSGLINLALAAFTKMAEEMMQWEATTLAGPKNRADASRENQRWGTQNGYCVVGGQKIPLKRARRAEPRSPSGQL